jgi:hypothetical protein
MMQFSSLAQVGIMETKLSARSILTRSFALKGSYLPPFWAVMNG